MLTPVCWLPQYRSGIRLDGAVISVVIGGWGGTDADSCLLVTPVQVWNTDHMVQLSVLSWGGGWGDRYPSTSLEYRSHGAVISVVMGGGDRYPSTSLEYRSHGAVSSVIIGGGGGHQSNTEADCRTHPVHIIYKTGMTGFCIGRPHYTTFTVNASFAVNSFILC